MFNERLNIKFVWHFQMKINFRDQLPKYLGETKLLTTKCCILEVEKLGPGNKNLFIYHLMTITTS